MDASYNGKKMIMRRVTITLSASDKIVVFQVDVRSDNHLLAKLSAIARSHKNCRVMYREVGCYQTKTYHGKGQ